MPDIFSPPLATKHAQELLREARKANATRDQLDGDAAPGRCPLDLHLRTVISALAAALDMDDLSCVAEALDMLQQAEVRARKEK